MEKKTKTENLKLPDKVGKNLKELVLAYYQNKREYDNYKEICNDENKSIKAIMSKYKLSSYKSDAYVATYKVIEKKSLNEAALIEFLLTDNAWKKVVRDFNIVLYKPSFDPDALERAHYQGAITDEMLAQLNKFETIKAEERLSIKNTSKEDK